MLSKIWKGVCGLVNRSVDAALSAVTKPMAKLVAVATTIGTALSGAAVFAQGQQQGPPDVTFTPIVNFQGIFETLLPAVGVLVAAALGLGIAIWGARYMFSIIKSMGR